MFVHSAAHVINTNCEIACIGSSVYSSATSLNWLSGNWDADYRTKRSVEARSPADASNCAVPNVVGYTTGDGEEYAVKVPEGKFEEVSGLVQAGDFEELAKLEAYDG